MGSSLRQPKMRSAAEKLAIIAEYEAAPRGERGAVARRLGVGRSQISQWMGARDQGELVEVRNQRPSAVTPPRQSREIARLRDQLAKSQAENEILKAAIETVGKAHALLQTISESAEPEPLSTSAFRRRSPH